MSVDARITQGDTVKTSFWQSVEDGAVLKRLISRHQVVVMGSGTYKVVQTKPNDHHLQVILTKNPAAYTDKVVPGSLEFVSMQPAQLVASLRQREYTSLLLLGGSSNIPFLEAGLVDELYLTVEPALFGAGLPLVPAMPAAVPLRLIESKQLNRQGTLLLHYEVIKNTVATGVR
jgi:dihydrofolate reductase